VHTTHDVVIHLSDYHSNPCLSSGLWNWPVWPCCDFPWHLRDARDVGMHGAAIHRTLCKHGHSRKMVNWVLRYIVIIIVQSSNELIQRRRARWSGLLDWGGADLRARVVLQLPAWGWSWTQLAMGLQVYLSFLIVSNTPAIASLWRLAPTHWHYIIGK